MKFSILLDGNLLPVLTCVLNRFIGLLRGM